MLTIAGNDVLMRLKVLSYETPSPMNISDANWLKCHIFLTFQYSTVDSHISLMTSDFLGMLLQCKQGEERLSFSTPEDRLSFTIQRACNNVTLRCCGTLNLGLPGTASSVLSFAFDINQDLANIKTQLEGIMDNYPVIR